MNPTRVRPGVLRSVGAVLTGIVAAVILSLGTDGILRAAGALPALGQPPGDGILAVATVYRTTYGVVGGYITARLAPARPMLHAMVGGITGCIVAVVGVIVTWNKGAEFGPHWYPIALAAFAVPSAWLGGKLCERMTPWPMDR